MTTLVLAFTVGILFASGTYLVLRRGQIKLILGLTLLSHGVNLLLFGAGTLIRGQPPIFLNKENYTAEILDGVQADPLPQALILTAIVISFGITAFIIVLVNRRHTITNTDVVHGELLPLLRQYDPFDTGREAVRHDRIDDLGYDWLAYEVDEVYDRDELPETFAPTHISEADESAALEKEPYE